MKSAIKLVFAKEVVDNFRDKRTLGSALLFGPLFGPALFVAVMSISLSRAAAGQDKALELPILGTANAPALIAFLLQSNVDPVDAPQSRDEAIQAVRRGTIDLALIIPADFSEQLRGAAPARVEIVADQANAQAARRAGQVRALIDARNAQIATLRLLARGIDPWVTTAVRVEHVDTSTPSGRSALILGMLTYFMLFPMLMGGMYLAIDTTAGERERGSLEPLLTLPITRGQLIIAKIFAACLFMVLSLAMALVAFVVALSFLPLEQFGMSTNFGPLVALKAFFILAPFALPGAALMTIVASFTKSYKEAQSYLTVLMLLPTLPIVVAAVLTLRPTLAMMTVPSLSQHLLITELIKDNALEPLYVAVSQLSSIGIGVILCWVAVKLYYREGLLA